MGVRFFALGGLFVMANVAFICRWFAVSEFAKGVCDLQSALFLAAMYHAIAIKERK